MKFFIATLSLALFAAVAPSPANASELEKNMKYFCQQVVTEANSAGLKAAPGTPFSRIVSSKAGYNQETYKFVWAIAKASNHSDCRRMY